MFKRDFSLDYDSLYQYIIAHPNEFTIFRNSNYHIIFLYFPLYHLFLRFLAQYWNHYMRRFGIKIIGATFESYICKEMFVFFL